MADLPIVQHQNWDVVVPEDVKRLWLDMQVQEFKSRINRTKQDIDDMVNGKVLGLKANLKMLELSLQELESKRSSIVIKGE